MSAASGVIVSQCMAAAARAMQFGFGAFPLFAREGGSNPILSTFEKNLHLPVIMFGIGSPGDNPHAANENLELANFHRGTVALARLFDEIAAAGWRRPGVYSNLISIPWESAKRGTSLNPWRNLNEP
jgi:acetylornithine deacetylase/succinyl-diaminopimelate desuccinylase-like protein